MRDTGTALKQCLSAPVSVDVSITGSCNLQCKYCYAEAGTTVTTHLPRDLLGALFGEFEQLGVHFVRIAGGEPLLHPEFFEIIEDLENIPINYSIATNGTLVSPAVANRLRRLNAQWVVVSLDGPTARINKQTRGGFKAVLNGITHLVHAGIPTSASIVLTASNAEHVADTVRLVRSLGVYKVAILIVCPVGRGNLLSRALELSPTHYQMAVDAALRLISEDPSLELRIVAPHESAVPWELLIPLSRRSNMTQSLETLGFQPETLSEPKRLGCNAGRTTCSISSDGNVYGCEQFMSFPDAAAGNIFRSSFGQIWRNSLIFRDLRSIKYQDLRGECASCEIGGCGGGCRAVAYAISGDLRASDSRCTASRSSNQWPVD